MRHAGQVGVDRDGHHARRLCAVEVKPVELVASAAVDLVRRLLLHGAHHHVVDLDRVGNRDDLAVPCRERDRLLVEHPVRDILDPGLGQQVERLVRLGEARALPAAWRPAGEVADGLDRVGDGGTLVLHLVHRLLDEAMPHEVPAGLVRGLAGLAIEFAGGAVDGERRLQLARLQRLQETPEADAHPVLVPRPVGDVGQQRLAHWRRQHRARHRSHRAPVLDVHDGPHRDAGVAGQDELRPLVDRQVGRAAAQAEAGLGHGLEVLFVKTLPGRKTAGEHRCRALPEARFAPAVLFAGSDPAGRRASRCRAGAGRPWRPEAGMSGLDGSPGARTPGLPRLDCHALFGVIRNFSPVARLA